MLQFTSTQLAGFNKGQLREACRAHSISYTSLNNDGMRDALASLATDAVVEVAAVQGEETAGAQAFIDSTVVPAVVVTEAEVTALIEAPREPRVLTDVVVPAVEPAPVKAPKVAKVPQPEQHGVKRPKNGTICAQIWDWCDAQDTAGVRPEAKVLRAALPGLDDTTKTVQFYRWRKFNGISGR